MSTAIVTGAICNAPIWVVITPRRISENGAATSDPGRAANIAVNASPAGTPGISRWVAIPAVPPVKSITRNGASDEAGGLAHCEHEDLREHDCDQEACTERCPVVDDRRELIGSRE